MACCTFSCLLYTFLTIFGLYGIIKLYLIFTTGRHRIKQSLKGKVIIITGGTAGLGKETVRELAKKDATIHVLARDLSKAERVIGEIKESTGNQDIHIHYVDLSNFSTVRAFVKKFLDTGSPVHILINNAGLANAIRKNTVDGNEETTQANHLSHFLLTNLLLDRIVESAPARIVNVSSRGHTMVSDFDVHDLNFEKRPNSWAGFSSYCWSKVMNVLFTRELARRLYGKGVTVNSLHPGGVQSEIARNAPWYHIIFVLNFVLRPFFKTSNEGAQTSLYLATAEEVEHVSGQYFSDCKIETISLTAADDQIASELWEESVRLTGLNKS